MYGYIYKTTNLINNKIYIGQKKSDEFVESYLGSGTILNRAIKKYGKENFKVEIIEWCKNLEELCERERHHIAKEKSLYGYGIGYNITHGGEFGDTFTHHPNKEEIRQAMSERYTGRKHTEEWKKQASKRFSGKGNPMYGVPSPMKGRKQTPEHTEKIRLANTGKKLSSEEKKKRAESYKKTVSNRTPEKSKEIFEKRSKLAKEKIAKYGHPLSKKVYVYKNGELVNEFINGKECSNYYYKEYGLPKKTVEANLRHDKPIFKEFGRGTIKRTYEIKKKFKDYDFTYVKY